MEEAAILQQVIGDVALAVLGYAAFEALLRWSRWM